MRLAVAAACLVLLVSCSKSTPSSTASTTQLSSTPAASDPRAGSVAGKAAPGAIVVLEATPPREFPRSPTPVMDQVALTFTPDLMFVRTGEPVEFRNSDDTLHNVHVGNSDTKESAFNVAIPTGEKYTFTFSKDGFYHVGCDIHPAMSAEILAVSTPFATVAAGDGSFAFDDVPPGPYVARTYAGGVKAERGVEIKAGANTIALAP